MQIPLDVVLGVTFSKDYNYWIAGRIIYTVTSTGSHIDRKFSVRVLGNQILQIKLRTPFSKRNIQVKIKIVQTSLPQREFVLGSAENTNKCWAMPRVPPHCKYWYLKLNACMGYKRNTYT